jgi:PAS domain S-box-containing protein
MGRPKTADSDFYRQLFEHAGVAFIATDEDFIIRNWNAAASRMFGASPESMIGTPLHSIVPQKQREQALKLFRRAIDHGEISELEFPYHDERGERRDLTVVISPIVPQPGTRIGVSAFMRDVTRRSKLQSQLLQSRKMAALGEMAGAMAHFFNNILGGIITSVDFARNSDDLVLKARILNQISEALSRATDLLEGLLSFAEGDRKDEDLSDVTEIVLSMADDFEAVLKAQNIKLVLDVPKLPVMEVPRVQMMTALRNVVQNAIDAMPDGGTLTIAVSLETDRIVTRIADTGCGLSEEELSRVFEPFWSTKGSLAGGSKESLGLGLSVAHGILQFIGGSVTAASTLGEGSTFIISLPRRKFERATER